MTQQRVGVTCQCIHPETGKTGDWLFSGDSHRVAGTSISPVFPDCIELYAWMKTNGWKMDGLLNAVRINQEN